MSAQKEAIRSFVAVDTSSKVKEEVGELVKGLKVKTAVPAKWVHPQQMHLTLVFLGEVSPEFIEKGKVCLEPIARQFRPFNCQFEGLGAFPSLVRARVLWLGLKRGEEELKELQKEVSRVLEPIGYRAEKRPFTPHLTLARLREPADMSLIKEVAFTSSPCLIDRFILFRSVLFPTGPEYTRLAEFFLKK